MPAGTATTTYGGAYDVVGNSARNAISPSTAFAGNATASRNKNSPTGSSPSIPTMPTTDCSENLIEIRERHGISQAELAERMNIPVQTIIGIENGSLEFLPYLTDYALEVGALVEYKITPYDITITEGERE